MRGDVFVLDASTMRILSDQGENALYLLACHPRIIAECCLEVLEVGNG